MNLPLRLVFAMVAAILAAGCASHAPAPVQDRRPTPVAAAKPPVAQAAKPAAPTPTAGRYIVRRGDTLYSIALEHGVDFRDVAKWNDIGDPAKIRVGQSLQVSAPEGVQATQAGMQVGVVRGSSAPESRPLDSKPSVQATAPDSATRTSPKALRLPFSEQNVALLSRGEAPAQAAPKPTPQPVAPGAKPETPKPAPERNPEGIEFIWPAKGSVLVGFSEPRVKGIDIGGRVGDPVVAAAAGKVIYVGAGIPGLGKFVVIKHNDELSTVYAHAKEILVKMDQSVIRGQRIAELGDSDADRPKLHFQVRRLGKPLDPMGYLPPG
ncbi:MAG: LysM peptidoglycan-binding domain-containing protein [Betaproteobacteria bacterium]|nr:LysM peptidoglycan-binding domain-containing protein [Betaproteobacteria bacterium]